MFVMGPQHTQRTADGIVDFARRVEIETLQVSVLTPLPGTPLYEEMRPHLIFNHYPADWDYYDCAHPVYNHARLGAAGLQQAVFKAHRDFYLWSAWRGRTLRSLASRRISALDKVRDLWFGIRTAQTVMRKWRKTSDAYIEALKTRVGKA
jgi:hypothetical protein